MTTVGSDAAVSALTRENTSLIKSIVRAGDHLPYAVALLSAPDFRFEYINSHYQAIAPGKSILNRTLAEVWPEIAEDCLPALRQVIETGVPFHESNVRFNLCRTPGAMPEPARFTYVWILLPAEGPAPARILAIASETTKLPIAGIAQAQQAQTVRLLAAGIAHDFNNLLTTMLGYASLGVAMEPPGSRASQYFSSIRESAEQAAALTRQMLAYSGQGRAFIQDIQLATLAAETVRLLSHTIPDHIQLELDLPPGPPEFEADPRQIEQLVTNLMLNAIEAIGHAPGVITVRTSVQHLTASRIRQEFKDYDPQPGAFACLEVSDTGCGIDPEILPRIFEPFFTTHFTGRGLGLAAVDGIICAAHGAIQVVTKSGLGSTFRLFLPATLLAASSETTGH